MDYKVKFANFELTLSDSDIVNPDEIDSGYPLWILHDHGFVVCAVWADHLQNAIDEAVDEDKMDRYLIDESDYAEYGVNTDESTCTFLGNACEPFDIEMLGYVELAPPKTRSNCAELAEVQPTVTGWHVI